MTVKFIGCFYSRPFIPGRIALIDVKKEAAKGSQREAVRHGRGRPTILYRPSKPSIEGAELLDVVTSMLQKLRHARRFEESRWCRKIKSSYTAEKCP